MPKGTTASSYVGRVGQRRQVVLPKPLCDQIGLEEGDLVEVTAKWGLMLVKPKRLVDADESLTPAEATKVRRGNEQLKRGQYKDWRDVKKHVLGR